MQTVFEKLHDQLLTVEIWLIDYLNAPLSAKEREVALLLQEYILQCWTDPKKWRSESKAFDAINKVERAWLALYAHKIKRLK